MSLAEIKEEVSRLTPSERAELALQLRVMKDLEDPDFLDSLTQAHSEAERGEGGISREELLARLQAAGRSL